MAYTQINGSSKILSSKKLSGLNCISENTYINPAVAVEALFAHGKQNWISGAYIICAKQSHHSFFPWNQMQTSHWQFCCRITLEDQACMEQWSILGQLSVYKAQDFFPNGNFLPPASGSHPFSAMWETFVISKKKELCSKSYKMKSSSIIISLKTIACWPMKALRASWWQQLQILILTF